MIAFDLERGTTVWTGRAQSKKRLDLLLQQALLGSFEELFGFLECQAQVLDALAVLLQGDDIRHGFFMAIVAAHDE